MYNVYVVNVIQKNEEIYKLTKNKMNLQNTNSKLRFFITEYWKWVKIPDLYDQMKKKVFKVKNASEISEEQKEKLIESYRYGLQALEQGVTSIEDARGSMIAKLK